MNDKDLKKLIIDTALALDIKSDKIKVLYLAINVSYNRGYLDAKLKKDIATTVNK